MNRDYDDFQSNIINTLQEIFDDFCDNQGMIDLDQTKQLIQTNKPQEGKLFLTKIQQARRSNKKIMNKNEFVRYFSTTDDEQHFSAVFDLIDEDKSRNISKKELAIMNEKYNIGLSKADIDAMISQISSDGQKVTKNQLTRFLAKISR